jgi:hypothetical protein
VPFLWHMHPRMFRLSSAFQSSDFHSFSCEAHKLIFGIPQLSRFLGKNEFK